MEERQQSEGWIPEKESQIINVGLCVFSWMKVGAEGMLGDGFGFAAIFV
jgi:hypothetical protein